MMAKHKKTKLLKNEEGIFFISVEKKKKLLGIFLTVFSLLIFLSILSYSKLDDIIDYKFSDLFRIFSSDPEFVLKIKFTHNWLGIFGALVSGFFINSTLGYFSIVIPIVLFIWGYTIIRDENYRLSIYLSNFLLIIGIILASFMGLLCAEFNVLTDSNQVYGNIGFFFGKAVGRLLGGLGGIIFLSALFLTTLIIAFDIRLSRIFTFIKKFFSEAFEDESAGISIKKQIPDKTENNLKKIQKLRKKKKLSTENLNEEVFIEELGEDKKETKIRIIRKDQDSSKPETEGEDISVEDTKAKDKEDDSQKIPQIDKDKEADLPDQWEEEIDYEFPNLELLDQINDHDIKISEEELKRNAELLKKKLSLFDIDIEDISVTPGPVVTLYEIVPAPGVKISRIVSLEHDIALALAARGIRIIAPIPGKSAIGVEIPNAEASSVSAREVLSKLKGYKAELPLALGKTISGDVYLTDLSTMPHLLIAGSTGAGKSVGLNMMIASLLYAKHPTDIKFVIIDPKKIEMSFYRQLTKHFLAVSPDLDEEVITNSQNSLLALKAVEYEMDNRYNKLAKAGVRNIVDYNTKVTNPRTKPNDTEDMKHHKLPYIIVIIDELADLMLASTKEVEEPITRLAQLARAVGIHLILATQRPSVNVITGVIKANFSARLAYQVASKIDSRTILDMNGAEQLLGRGDMLFLPGGAPKPIRIQNAFITTEEVEKITNYIYVQKGFSKRYFLPSMFEKKTQDNGNFLADIDPMFEDAARVIVRHQQGSVSLLQRRLKLGYSRAARIVDQLEEAGIVGPPEGSKPRAVNVENEDQLETLLRTL